MRGVQRLVQIRTAQTSAKTQKSLLNSMLCANAMRAGAKRETEREGEYFLGSAQCYRSRAFCVPVEEEDDEEEEQKKTSTRAGRLSCRVVWFSIRVF